MSGSAASADAGARLGRPWSALWDEPARAAAAIALGCSGVLHATVIGRHFAEYQPFGLFFAALSVAQLFASFLLPQANGRLLRVTAWCCVGVAALWVASRTTGLPVGPDPWHPEAAGLLDVVSTGLELLVADVCFVLAGRAAGTSTPVDAQAIP